ncbi:MAG: hypothetical protein MGG11_16970 [Trichodesmium sp. MAG_R03]|nr:hypothetical protein [Trichodesmium sp. MAG_R03]
MKLKYNYRAYRAKWQQVKLAKLFACNRDDIYKSRICKIDEQISMNINTLR